MKLQAIYDLAIELGIERDPRGKEEIRRLLEETKEAYEKLEGKDKEFFDTEKLKNPYSDTRILAGDPSIEVTGAMSGIDLEVPEVVLADRLRERGEQIDLLLSHHPEGRALAALPEVMGMQADIWHRFGVPINVGDVLIDRRMKEVSRTLMPLNHERSIDAARLLGFAFMSVHTPADNLVTAYIQKTMEEKAPRTVKDVLEVLREIPEYEAASRNRSGPAVIVGDPSRRAGKIMVDMTGGTEGPEEAIEKLGEAGVGTLVQMHLGEKLRKKAEKANLNVVIAGHVASDAIGLNLFLDKLEGRGVKVISCSGLVRVKRKT